MDLIKTGIEITRAFKNIGRLREIVTVFARNGFDEFINQSITSRIPEFVLPKSRVKLKAEFKSSSASDIQGIIGRRLRICFEELGPAFIKLGQLLSSREDIFSESFISEMQVLQDQARGVPFEQVVDVIESSLKRPLSDVFKNIDQSPIGTASIGVAYIGELHSGQDVVIKVKRPNIEEIIQEDFSIMLFLANQLEKASSELKYLGISRLVRDFAVSLTKELNFDVERLNCQRFKENLERNDTEKIFYVPKIYKEYSNRSILVMEFLDGRPFSKIKKDEVEDLDLQEKLNYGVKQFIKSLLKDGFFHADLHGGNFFLLENGKIGLIDFGLMGTLSFKGRQNFMAILYSLINLNYENLVYEFLDVADYESIPDVEELISDVRDALSPFIGLTVQQTNYSQVFAVIIDTLRKHRIYLPREWFIVFRSLITLDGVGKNLGIDFDIFGILESDIKELLQESFSKDKLIEEGIWAGRELIGSLRIMPRHLKWFVKEFSKNNFAFNLHHQHLKESIYQLANALRFVGLLILAGVLILSGVLLVGNSPIAEFKDIPKVGLVFWVMGGAVLVRAWTMK